MCVELGNGSEPCVVHFAHVPAHRDDAILSIDRVLESRDDEWCTASISHLEQRLAVALNVVYAMDSDTLVTLAFLYSLALLFAADTFDVGTHLGSSVEGVDKQTILEPEQVVAEE